MTVKNVEGKALNSTISQLTKSFDRLFKRAKVQRNLLGQSKRLAKDCEGQS
ncbi:hypothetical protein ACXONU_09010 [Streptococcus thermophilus]